MPGSGFTSQNVYDAIVQIRQTSGRLDKIDLLRRYMKDQLFRRCIRYAYDPTKTFYVYRLGSYTPSAKLTNFTEDTWYILDTLDRGATRGQYAQDMVLSHLTQLDPKSAYVLEWILKRDMRAGFTAESINAAVPGTIPIFKCMLAHKFEEKRMKQWPQLVQPKIDGNRVLVFVGSNVQFFTRTGKPITSLDHFKPAFFALACGQNVVFDCEAAGTEFNESSGQIRQQQGNAVGIKIWVFDIVDSDTFAGIPSDSQSTRLMRLDHHFGRLVPEYHDVLKKVPTYEVRSLDEIYSYYERFRGEGFEGAMVKEISAPYVPKRSYAWLKMKAVEEIDVPVIDCIEGTGKYVNCLGAFTVQLPNGQTCEVGTGLSDEQRYEFWDDWINDKEWIHNKPIIEVEFHEWTPAGKLRHPRFIKLRPDKS